MASPEPPADSPDTTPEPASTGIPLRTLTAWALVGVAALIVLFAFLRWVFPTQEGLGTSRFNVFDFANLTVIAAPLLGILVASKLGPALKNAKLLVTIALSTYAAAAVFGLVSFFVGLADHFDPDGREGIYAFGFILQGLGGILDELLFLALVLLAGLWTIKIAGSLGTKLPSVNINPEDE